MGEAAGKTMVMMPRDVATKLADALVDCRSNECADVDVAPENERVWVSTALARACVPVTQAVAHALDYEMATRGFVRRDPCDFMRTEIQYCLCSMAGGRARYYGAAPRNAAEAVAFEAAFDRACDRSALLGIASELTA
jgi:hypothetical protein